MNMYFSYARGPDYEYLGQMVHHFGPKLKPMKFYADIHGPQRRTLSVMPQ